jgi:hypothetical protein
MSPELPIAMSITQFAQSSWLLPGRMLLDPISLKRVVELTFVKSRGLNRKISLRPEVSHFPRCEVT